MSIHGIAALGWLPTAGARAGPQIALPTDLFLLTVHRAADLASEPSVTLLRTRPQAFAPSAAGELAYALLTPAGLLALLRTPLEGLADRSLPLSRLCGPAEGRALRDALHAEPDPARRVRALGAWLEGRLARRHHFGLRPQRVAEAATLIQQASRPPDLAALRERLRVSPRQLERDFRQWLGVSPGAYARVVRFQRAAMGLAAGERLSDAAAGHDYADQSHLNRAFRQLGALTPGQFAERAAALRRHPERRPAGRVVVVDAG